MRKPTVGFATTVLLATGMGAAAFGLGVGVAQASPQFVPEYHWCPGDQWDPGWGNNWESGTCHDDHHRDMDGWDRSRDWNPPPPPPQPWQPWLPWQQ